MGLFSRRRHDRDDDPATEEDPSATADGRQESGTSTGPWDQAEAPEATRVDLGALRVPVVDGMQLRLEAPAPGADPVAAILALGGSTLELRAFAAPRTAGIWEELRQDLTAELGRQGARLRMDQGPHGPEILAQVPVRDAKGDQGTVPLRFIGIDGPRWFLRAVLQGRAAMDDDAAAPLRQVLHDVVVVRDQEARPPREFLPLHPPGAVRAPEAHQLPGLDPLSPGPTIAEVR